MRNLETKSPSALKHKWLVGPKENALSLFFLVITVLSSRQVGDERLHIGRADDSTSGTLFFLENLRRGFMKLKEFLGNFPNPRFVRILRLFVARDEQFNCSFDERFNAFLFSLPPI
jgi:hypothetical protein